MSAPPGATRPALALAALGVVFGDIGTSPRCYALPPERPLILGTPAPLP